MAAGSRLASMLADSSLGSAMAADPIWGSVVGQLRDLQGEIDRRVADRPDHRRLAVVVDLITSAVRGVVADGLLARDRGFGVVDDEDFRDWLTRHGARPDTTEQRHRARHVRPRLRATSMATPTDPDSPPARASSSRPGSSSTTRARSSGR